MFHNTGATVSVLGKCFPSSSSSSSSSSSLSQFDFSSQTLSSIQHGTRTKKVDFREISSYQSDVSVDTHTTGTCVMFYNA